MIANKLSFLGVHDIKYHQCTTLLLGGTVLGALSKWCFRFKKEERQWLSKWCHSNRSWVIILSVYTVSIYQQCNNNEKHVYHNWILLTVDTAHAAM